MNTIILLAQRGANNAANSWLAEHPFVLGLIFLALGGVLAGWGAVELSRGLAHDKYGNEMRGGMGKTLAIIRLVAGVFCIGFAIYKMVTGFMA